MVANDVTMFSTSMARLGRSYGRAARTIVIPSVTTQGAFHSITAGQTSGLLNCSSGTLIGAIDNFTTALSASVADHNPWCSNPGSAVYAWSQ